MTLTLKVTKYNVYDKRKMSIIKFQCKWKKYNVYNKRSMHIINVQCI